MSSKLICTIYNGETADRADIPVFSVSQFREIIINETSSNARITSMFGMPGSGGQIRLFAVLAEDSTGALKILSADVKGSYAALTPDCPQAHLFEREIAERWNLTPLGHPWLKPVRFPSVPNDMIGITDFFKVEGDEIHEVAVGPVHAGIIEPGHFRFQCYGENVFHLEISLGYQHRGIEQALLTMPQKRHIHYMETVAGDTTMGHVTAYCQILEAFASCNVSARAEVLRGIALELERLAYHTGDLGALAGDVGYLPTASFCGRIRGDFLNMTALLCGSRFGRGLVRPGGAAFDLNEDIARELEKRLEKALKDVTVAVNLLWTTPSILNRFEDTGALSQQTCNDLGIVGPAARACGIGRDTRFDFASGIYRFSQMPVSTWHTGDVFGRAYVRWIEIQHSITFIQNQLSNLPRGKTMTSPLPLASDKISVSLVEGWRGEICHVAITNDDGQLAHYKIVDPSFHNWMALAIAMRNQQISDFPLCNKSFNLSYCGYDL
jgi:Ni,Fe-hydrogenase III large subunit